MCGRNSLFVPQSELEERFDATATEPFEPRYNIAPGEDLAVVRNDEPDAIDLLEWGLLPPWADDPDVVPRPINARSETAAENPMFRDAVERRHCPRERSERGLDTPSAGRCLVLSSGFYEWQERTGGSKQPYRIYLEGDEPFAFAGLWDRWEGEGTVVDTVTILTTDASDPVEPVHDRMPVVLEPDEEAAWLAADSESERESLLDPYDGDDLRIDPISRAVNDPGNDSPAIVEPVAVDEQSGLDDFEG